MVYVPQVFAVKMTVEEYLKNYKKPLATFMDLETT